MDRGEMMELSKNQGFNQLLVNRLYQSARRYLNKPYNAI